MILLKLIRKNREKVFSKFFRKEIYTSELVGEFLMWNLHIVLYILYYIYSKFTPCYPWLYPLVIDLYIYFLFFWFRTFWPLLLAFEANITLDLRVNLFVVYLYVYHLLLACLLLLLLVVGSTHLLFDIH